MPRTTVELLLWCQARCAGFELPRVLSLAPQLPHCHMQAEAYVYDICPNKSCSFVFRCEFHALDTCKVCNTKRYDENKKARKVCYYIPVSPWLQELWQSFPEALRWHHTRDAEEGVIKDVQDSGKRLARCCLTAVLYSYEARALHCQPVNMTPPLMQTSGRCSQRTLRCSLTCAMRSPFPCARTE
jgi:hypothetical protein